MAKINALPSLEVINVLKGTLDYYYWKGIPCVRKWPVIPKSSRTPASMASALLFGQIVQGWGLTGGAAKALYIQAAADQPRTGRDLYVSGALGNLHEASMSDFLDLLTAAAASLSNLEGLLNALGSVDTDDLQIDIKSALTTLPVKGMDQLFSFKGVLALNRSAGCTGADGYVDSPPVPVGQVWCVTTARIRNGDRASTEMRIAVVHDTLNRDIQGEIAAFAAGERFYWNGITFLDYQDVIRGWFIGANNGDNCNIQITGFGMTPET